MSSARKKIMSTPNPQQLFIIDRSNNRPSDFYQTWVVNSNAYNWWLWEVYGILALPYFGDSAGVISRMWATWWCCMSPSTDMHQGGSLQFVSTMWTLDLPTGPSFHQQSIEICEVRWEGNSRKQKALETPRVFFSTCSHLIFVSRFASNQNSSPLLFRLYPHAVFGLK